MTYQNWPPTRAAITPLCNPSMTNTRLVTVSSPLLLVLSPFVLVCVCLGQTRMSQFGDVGVNANDFSRCTANIGDVNGDGVGDFAVGCPLDDANGTDAGKVMVMSGRNGGVIATMLGPGPGSLFGHSVGYAGDVDGNGTADIVIGAPFWGNAAGQVRVCEAVTGVAIRVYLSSTAGERFGWSVDGMGDVNGNGSFDVIVSAPWWNQQRGRVVVIDTLSGSNIHLWTGFFSNDRLGTYVDGAIRFGLGVDVPRVVISDQGSVRYAINSWTLQSISVGSSPIAKCVGDFNGDGRIDIGVGQPERNATGAGNPPVQAGRMTVYSLTSFIPSIVYQRQGQANGERLGADFDAIGDWDADGFLDLAIGSPLDGTSAPTSASGRVDVISGRTLGVATSFRGPRGYGTSVTHANDINGDGHSELLAGSPMGVAPFAELVSGGDEVRVDTGCRATLSATRSSPFLFQPITFTGNVNSQGPNPLGIAVVAIGLRWWPINIIDPVSSCVWHVDPSGPLLVDLAVISPSGGFALTMAVPPNPLLIGQTLFSQSLTLSDMPIAFSNAVSFVML